MAYREDQLNGRIASAINRIAGASGWEAREEAKGAFLPAAKIGGGANRESVSARHIGASEK